MKDTKADADLIFMTAEKELKKVLSFIQDNIANNINSFHAYKGRVKPSKKLLEKVNSKLKKKPDYTLRSITDVIGARCIVLDQADMPEVVEKIVSNIFSDDSNGLFEKSIYEIIYYKGNVEHSNISSSLSTKISALEEQYATAGAFNFIDNPSSKRYSSIHLICKLAQHSSEALEDYKVPVEIQIRTVFEDAWSEIDHKYNYKNEYTSDEIEPLLDNHFEVLKKMTDACVDYTNVIINHLPLYKKLDSGTAPKTQLDDSEDLKEVQDIFKKESLSEEVISEYYKVKAIQEKNIPNKINQLNDPENCLDTVKAFEALLHKFSSEAETSDAFNYHVNINIAYCLLATNVSTHIINALDLYRKLDKMFVGYPIIKMRMGQAYAKLDQFDKAILLIEDAYNQSLKLKESREFTFRLTKSDYEHIMIFVPKFIGFYIWSRIDRGDFENDQDKLSQYNECLRWIKTGEQYLEEFGKNDEAGNYQNNKLYYTTEIVKLSAKLNVECDLDLEEEISKYEDLYRNSSIEQDIDGTQTLLNAYYAIDNSEKCEKFAITLDSQIHSEDGEMLGKDQKLKFHAQIYDIRKKYNFFQK